MPQLHLRRLIAVAALAAGLLALVVSASASGRARTARSAFSVVARGLNNPRQLSIAPNGALYVAEAGTGGTGACGPNPGEGGQACIGSSGSIARIVGHTLRRVVSGLPSVAPANGQGATGPSQALVSGKRLVFTIQTLDLDQKTGANPFGSAGSLLGFLASSPLGRNRPTGLVNLAAFEFANNPDHGVGSTPGGEQPIDSDPYAVAAYRGGFVVADAAANDLLWIDAHRKVHVLAVFPLNTQLAPAGVAGPTARQIPTQAVPTSVVVGRGGALYVGELTGFPFQPGHASIFRIVPGKTPVYSPSVYATGFTDISALALDRKGRLIVVEIDKSGLLTQAPGAVIRLDSHKHKTTLASAGLITPTGVAVAKNGNIYVSNNGTFPGSGPGPHGQVVRLAAR